MFGKNLTYYRLKAGMTKKELAEKAKAYHEGEEKQMEGILQRGEWPRSWVDAKLEEVGFEFVD